MRGLRSIIPMVFVASATSCADAGADGAPEAVVRDSAGIAIVENPLPNDATPVWRAGETPSADIGVLEGAPEYQLEEVRHAARLSDGRILIADAGAHALRFYDADGTHIRSVGGEGSGPGEFGQIGSVFLGPGDSIWTWDWRLHRLSVFSPNGEFARSAQVDPPSGGTMSPRPFAAFADGRIVVGMNRPLRPGDPGGIVRDTTPLYLYSSAGQVADSLGAWPGWESYVQSSGTGVSMTSRAFGRQATYTIAGSTLWVGDSDRYEIVAHEDGRPVRIVRRAWTARPVTAADRDEYVRRLTEEAEEEWREFMERMMSDMPFPASMPAFSAVDVDGAGNLWVREYAPIYDDESAGEWSVFDADGRLVAVAHTPPGLQVTDIGEDWVLGIRRDEFDVQHVRLHSLAKSGDGG